MSYIWAILLVCLMAGGTLFFAVNAIALRSFSWGKLQDALKSSGNRTAPQGLADDLAKNAERLILTCSLCRFVLNVGIVLVLVDVVLTVRQAGPSMVNYLIAALAASAVFSAFSLAIPHAWAKYAGEKILSRTYRLLMVFALLASPPLATAMKSSSRSSVRIMSP